MEQDAKFYTLDPKTRDAYIRLRRKSMKARGLPSSFIEEEIKKMGTSRDEWWDRLGY